MIIRIQYFLNTIVILRRFVFKNLQSYQNHQTIWTPQITNIYCSFRLLRTSTVQFIIWSATRSRKVLLKILNILDYTALFNLRKYSKLSFCSVTNAHIAILLELPHINKILNLLSKLDGSYKLDGFVQILEYEITVQSIF